MNREIKFRGMCTQSGEWVYGYYLMDGETHRIFEINRKSLTSTGFYTGTRVIPETVGQYTGLKDKDGKEIYEGDVLKVNKAHDHYINRNYVVIYDDAAFQIETPEVVGRCSIVKFIYDAFHKGAIEEFADYPILFSVLGNIHDNPELIK